MGPNIPGRDWVKVDLAPGSILLQGWIPGDMPDLERRIAALVTEAGGRFGWGGYLEERRLYHSSTHFGAGREARTLHLGVDVWAAAGTPVFAPFDAMVHSLAYNEGHLDYGATIILHHPGQGAADYTLFGHLCLEDLARWRPGDQVRAGTPFGHIGPPNENGGWAPHLHVQYISNIGSFCGDFPGVALAGERAAWVARCPDPLALLFPDAFLTSTLEKR